jgi:uncharacterized phage protein (TIGR02218 family)
MSFAQYEMSRQDGIPASLFLIEWGNSHLAYTDSDVEITFGGKVYKPIPIGRSEIVASGTLDKKEMVIDITPSAEIVKMYATNPPQGKIGIVIYQGHVDDPTKDYKAAWSGVIKNVNWEGPNPKIVAEPLDSILARPGLRRFYMLGCPHVLYDQRTCKANKETLKRTVIPTLIGANYARMPSGWNATTAKSSYIGGYVEWTDAAGNTQVRTILNTGATEDDLIIGATTGLTLGTQMFVYAGCPHTLTGCRDLHNNVVNFGGQPYIPIKNPTGYNTRFF